MQIRTWMLCLALFYKCAMAGPIYRCMGEDGVPEYTDRSCAGRGERIEETELRPNLYTGEPVAKAPAVPAVRARSPQSASRQSGCNNAADLRHIDLMLKSLLTDARQQRFLKAERRRVQKCELENLPADARRRRDAALRRIRALRASEREAAKLEIEGLYAAHRPRKKNRKE